MRARPIPVDESALAVAKVSSLSAIADAARAARGKRRRRVVAYEMGVEPIWLGRFEGGQVPNPTFDKLLRVCAWLGRHANQSPPTGLPPGRTLPASAGFLFNAIGHGLSVPNGLGKPQKRTENHGKGAG